MTTLAQYEAARAALAQATKIDQILPIMDEVEHVKLYARQINDQALLADASEFQMRAERRLGFVIAEAKKAGHFVEHRPKKNNGNSEEPLSATLADVGVSKRLSSTAQKRSSISEQAFEAMVEGMRDRISAGRAKIIEAPLPSGARAIAPNRVEPDDSLDYFPTPPWATRALIKKVFPVLGIRILHTVWEPACGEGHIAEVLSEFTDNVCATDVHDYGYGVETGDFLNTSGDGFWGDWIITNPPFGDKTEAFILRALENADVGVAMFVRLQWLEGIGRYERVFKDHPPTLISFFTERVNLCKGRWDPDGTTATAYIWLVWVKGMSPRAPFWIPPGQREALSEPDDIERFTAHPVIKKTGGPPPPAEPADHGAPLATPMSAGSPSPWLDGRSPDDDLSIPENLRRSFSI